MNQEQSEHGDWITPLAVGLHAIVFVSTTMRPLMEQLSVVSRTVLHGG